MKMLLLQKLSIHNVCYRVKNFKFETGNWTSVDEYYTTELLQLDTNINLIL